MAVVVRLVMTLFWAALGGACQGERPLPPPLDGGIGPGAAAGSGAAVCGGRTCPTAPLAVGAARLEACCLDAEVGCGFTGELTGGACMAPGRPGAATAQCPAEALDGVVHAGCCTPSGLCGLLDERSGLGCVPLPTALGEPLACAYNDSADCSVVVELPCDGAEDCADGQACCGRWQGGHFDAFGCFEACDAMEPAQQGSWFELCHEADDCSDPEHTCGESHFLPPFLKRCAAHGVEGAAVGPGAPGRVRCGEDVCAADEKCCLRDPRSPLCLPQDRPCPCVVPGDAANGGSMDGGAPDGGGQSPGDGGSPGLDGGGAPRDAASAYDASLRGDASAGDAGQALRWPG